MEGLKCAPRARGTVNVLRATRVCATGQVVYMRLVLSALTGRDARGYVRIMAAPTRGNAANFTRRRRTDPTSRWIFLPMRHFASRSRQVYEKVETASRYSKWPPSQSGGARVSPELSAALRQFPERAEREEKSCKFFWARKTMDGVQRSGRQLPGRGRRVQDGAEARATSSNDANAATSGPRASTEYAPVATRA